VPSRNAPPTARQKPIEQAWSARCENWFGSGPTAAVNTVACRRSTTMAPSRLTTSSRSATAGPAGLEPLPRVFQLQQFQRPKSERPRQEDKKDRYTVQSPPPFMAPALPLGWSAPRGPDADRLSYCPKRRTGVLCLTQTGNSLSWYGWSARCSLTRNDLALTQALALSGKQGDGSVVRSSWQRSIPRRTVEPSPTSTYPWSSGATRSCASRRRKRRFVC
jgi:hypothetical protein